MSDLEPVLRAIEEVRDEGRAREVKTDARLNAFELKLADVASLGESNARHIGEFSASLLHVASAAARAADLALEAKRQASNASDEASKIVESALRIHGASIATSVDVSVKSAIQPLTDDIIALKKSDAEKTTTLANQDTQLALAVSLLSKLARWQSHPLVKIAIAVSGLVGAGVAGYLGAH